MWAGLSRLSKAPSPTLNASRFAELELTAPPIQRDKALRTVLAGRGVRLFRAKVRGGVHDCGEWRSGLVGAIRKPSEHTLRKEGFLFVTVEP